MIASHRIAAVPVPAEATGPGGNGSCVPACASGAIAFSISVKTFFVAALKTCIPTVTAIADEPSCARTIVNTSLDTFVHRATSAFKVDGAVFAGHNTTLNGAAGNFEPSPDATVNEVPDVAGDGAVATVENAKFA